MSVPLAWAALLLAGLLDVGWAVSMKLSQGYSRLDWSLASIAFLAAFVYLLGRALAVLPLGTAYAVWTGAGAVGTVVVGAWLFGEAMNPLRLAGIVIVFVGIVVLKLAPMG